MKIIKGDTGTDNMKFTHVQVAVRLVGEGTEGKMKGKTVYKMFDFINIGEAKPDEVYSIVLRAIDNASQRK